MKPIVYRWDNDQAPVGDPNVRGSWCKVLKACLVTGYGDKPGAGWTMPFADADETVIILRNNETEGTGNILQVDCKSHTLSQKIGFTAAETCSDETTLFNIFLRKHYIKPFSSKWVVIADDRFFYLFQEGDSRRIVLCSCFGDVEQKYGSTPLCVISTSEETDSGRTDWEDSSFGCYTTSPSSGKINLKKELLSNTLWTARDVITKEYLNGSAEGITNISGGGLLHRDASVITEEDWANPMPLIISEPLLAARGKLMGKIPGLYHCNKVNPAEMGSIVDIDGREFYVISGKLYWQKTKITLAIDLDNWRA